MIKCKICGCEFVPVIDKHYVTRDNGESGMSTMFKQVEGNVYDTFDCPRCGCQMLMYERFPAKNEIKIAEERADECNGRCVESDDDA